MRVILVILACPIVALLLFSCGRASSYSNRLNADSIIGGTQVTERRTPAAKSVLQVEIRVGGTSVLGRCTGTLIGSHTILTSGHCLDAELLHNFHDIQVNFALADSVHPDQSLIRSQTVFAKHPLYNTVPFESYENRWNAQTNQYDRVPVLIPKKGFDHDIGVVVFSGSVPAGFAPVQIDSDENANYAGATDYIYGYGRTIDYTGETNESVGRSSGFLHRGVMEVMSTFSPTAESFFVQQKNNQNYICTGDSGGPHFYQENGVLKVIGVTSTSGGGAEVLANHRLSCKGIAKAARVAPAAQWIRQTAQQLLQQLNVPRGTYE